MRNPIFLLLTAAGLVTVHPTALAQDVRFDGASIFVTATPAMVNQRVPVPPSTISGSTVNVYVNGARDLWCMRSITPDFQAWLTEKVYGRSAANLQELKSGVSSSSSVTDKMNRLFGSDSEFNFQQRRLLQPSEVSTPGSPLSTNVLRDSEVGALRSGQPVEVQLKLNVPTCFSAKQLDDIVAEGLRVIDLLISRVK